MPATAPPPRSAASQSTHLLPKDPPTYDSLYIAMPQSSSSSTSSTSSQSDGCCTAVQRFLYRQAPFLQRLAAATFVATTVSTTVMLLLWQLQNLTTPEDDRPWFDPDEVSDFISSSS
ncbi:hypothetical protein BDB00DRAFT_939339 [Zychaea mexicana]|uniref:uncharacterized protein n=1 Tax=Zychaea mexicana TaxID=64656 RepID=UPI0022FDDB20|nr:uncharacterized protein BDB00DRAFT_939339 [Zychaea mexicana]KAI9492901.1 hypothetical protein BDB00DRAFT_939339 [Zychaea mexicana]